MRILHLNYMKRESEDAVERLLKIAMESDGEVYFHDSFLYRNDTCDLKEINLLLSMFGVIHGKMVGGSWTYFSIDATGIEFMENGGFEGKRKRNEYRNRMEKLSLANAELQNNDLLHKQKIRHQEDVIRWQKYALAVSWFIVAFLLIVGFIKF